MMNILLTITEKNSSTTYGVINIDGIHFCDAQFDNSEINIPSGKQQVVISYSPSLKRQIPIILLEDSKVRISNVKDSKSILVGRKKANGLSHKAEVLDNLMLLIDNTKGNV